MFFAVLARVRLGGLWSGPWNELDTTI